LKNQIEQKLIFEEDGANGKLWGDGEKPEKFLQKSLDAASLQFDLCSMCAQLISHSASS